MAREKGMGNLQREKSGRWTARICIDGVRISRTTRTTDRVKAEKFLQRMLAPLGLGDRTLALAEVWREYEKSPNRRDLAASTLNAKRVIWMHFAEWMELNHPEITHLNYLTRVSIAEYLRVMRVNHSSGTYNNRVCVLREVCRVLAEQAGIEEDPWKGVRLLDDDSHTRREFTIDELQRVVASAERAKGSWRMLFLIGIYTGLRLGDCCCLHWREVDLARGIIQVLPRKVRKHRHGRPVTIPIHNELRLALTQLKGIEDGRDGYVMKDMSEWYLGQERWRVSVGLEKIFREARIVTSIQIEGRRTRTPDATFHSLRHTFVSLSANAGVPLPIVQSIVGHSSTAMTRHYYHENEMELRRAIATIPSLDEIRENGMGRKELPDGAPANRVRNSSLEQIAKRLEVLEDLKRDGLIKLSEYRNQRARILSDV